MVAERFRSCSRLNGSITWRWKISEISGRLCIIDRTTISFESTALKSHSGSCQGVSVDSKHASASINCGFYCQFRFENFQSQHIWNEIKEISSIFWADDIWKNSAPHKINYKQLAIVCLMILRRRKIEEKFFRIKLKLIEWMKTEKIYCLFRDLHGIGVEIASRNVLNALVGMQVAISISIPMLLIKNQIGRLSKSKARGGDCRPFYTKIYKSITFTVRIVAAARKYSIF